MSQCVLPAQQQLWVVFALQVAVDEVWQQVLQDIGGVLQPPLQRRHDEWGHVTAVSHGEGPLSFQCADESEQKHLVVDELSEQLQGLLHVLLAVTRHLEESAREFMTILLAPLGKATITSTPWPTLCDSHVSHQADRSLCSHWVTEKILIYYWPRSGKEGCKPRKLPLPFTVKRLSSVRRPLSSEPLPADQ